MHLYPGYEQSGNNKSGKRNCCMKGEQNHQGLPTANKFPFP